MSQTERVDTEAKFEKKQYASPALVELGAISKMTQGSSGAKGDGPGGMTRT